MNKNDFLRRLEKELSLLDKNEIKELLDFYEERFYNGVYYENKTEQQVISELEPPEVIAKNVMEQYGINPKRTKVPEERFEGISIGSIVWLGIVDFFFLSWLIPTIFGVMIAVFGSLLGYIPVISLVIGEKTQYDVMVFWFLTGVFILLFHFALVILDLFMWTIKRTIKFHLDTFKVKRRAEYNKRMNKVHVDGFFKKYRTLGKIKRISFVTSLVLLGIFGFRIAINAENIYAIYVNQTTISESITYEAEQDIIDGAEWTINTEVDNMDIVVRSNDSNTIIITREYQEESQDFNWSIDENTKTITITQDFENMGFQSFNDINLENIMKWIKKDVIYIDVPSNLILGNVELETMNGEVEVSQVAMEELTISTANGFISLSDSFIENDLNIIGFNSNMLIEKVTSNGDLDISSQNGRLTLIDTEFKNYDVSTENGRVKLTNINKDTKSGGRLDVHSSNGSIVLTEVYVATVNAETSNGNISYNNNDQSFVVDFDGDTSNGNVSGNVD